MRARVPALGAALIVAGGMLAACGGDDADDVLEREGLSRTAVDGLAAGGAGVFGARLLGDVCADVRRKAGVGVGVDRRGVCGVPWVRGEVLDVGGAEPVGKAALAEGVAAA